MLRYYCNTTMLQYITCCDTTHRFITPCRVENEYAIAMRETPTVTSQMSSGDAPFKLLIARVRRRLSLVISVSPRHPNWGSNDVTEVSLGSLGMPLLARETFCRLDQKRNSSFNPKNGLKVIWYQYTIRQRTGYILIVNMLTFINIEPRFAHFTGRIGNTIQPR